MVWILSLLGSRKAMCEHRFFCCPRENGQRPIKTISTPCNRFCECIRQNSSRTDLCPRRPPKAQFVAPWLRVIPMGNDVWKRYTSTQHLKRWNSRNNEHPEKSKNVAVDYDKSFIHYNKSFNSAQTQDYYQDMKD